MKSLADYKKNAIKELVQQIHLSYQSAQQTGEMKGLIFTTCFIFCALLDTGLVQATTTTPLYRYWKASVSDHFYTTDPNEIGTTTPGQVGKHGYVSEGSPGLVYKYQVLNSVPLYRYWKASVSDHFYTTNSAEIGTTIPGQTGKHGYKSEGVTGFCMPRQTDDTIPLYRYWKASVSDHFYTTTLQEIGTADPGKEGRYGYVSEGITCYVLPPY